MRTTVAYINVNNLKHNLRAIRKLLPGVAVTAIVKANAYGHGITEIAGHLKDVVEFFGVAFVQEGMMLREAGITNPVVVLVPDTNDAVHYCDHNLQPAVSDLNFLRNLSARAVEKNTIVKVHLYVDTGMKRDGITPVNAVSFMKEASKLKNIEFSGLLSHFATSGSDIDFARKQHSMFNYTVKELKDSGYNFEYTHMSNTRGILNLPEANFNMVRPGIALYGYPQDSAGAAEYGFKPVMQLKSTVISMRKVNSGETVGYDSFFRSDRDTNVATIPIGYGDGYLKALQGKAECLIRGKRYKIVGTICMDECMADIGQDEISVGDEVVLIGSQGNEKLLADELAAKAGTIIYDVVTSIASRVPRIYVG